MTNLKGVLTNWTQDELEEDRYGVLKHNKIFEEEHHWPQVQNLENLETEKQAVNFVPFVKSSSVLPGTIQSHPTNNGVEKVEESAATETEQSAGNSSELVNFEQY